MTFKKIDRILPFDLYEKIVMLKIEKERKTDPIAFIMNGKMELTPYQKYHVFDHLTYGEVSMKSIKSFFKLYEHHRDSPKFMRTLVDALTVRFKSKQIYDGTLLKNLTKLLGNDLSVEKKDVAVRIRKKGTKDRSYKAFLWFFAVIDD